MTVTVIYDRNRITAIVKDAQICEVNYNTAVMEIHGFFFCCTSLNYKNLAMKNIFKN